MTAAKAISGTPRVSVVVLTRDRPVEYRALLRSLQLQRMTDFEVIVVGAEPSARDHGTPANLLRRITYAQCVDQNISLSRNIGLALAKGEIVAFIDDDAIPEPDWLECLLPGFDVPDVGAVGGFVRGRNGVDWQWRGAVVDRYGSHRPLTAEDLATPALSSKTAEAFVSTVGVNGAFRREALNAIGGFDENYHYFLDESDVCIRLLQAGWRTILTPHAEVHHAYAESSERRRNRAPRDLFQIAASRAYFSRIYGKAEWVERELNDFVEDQRRRMTKFVQLGRLSRRQVEAIMARLKDGLIEGDLRWRAGPLLGAPRSTPPHQPRKVPFIDPTRGRRPRTALVVAGSARGAVYRAARLLADKGCEVTIIDFELRPRRLRVWFEEGIWLHVGGILGRDRFGAPLPFPRRCSRVKREMNRIAPRRDFDVIIRPNAAKYRIGALRPVPVTGSLTGYVAEPLRNGGADRAANILKKNGRHMSGEK